MTGQLILDILKILAPIAVSYIALLKTRTDLDRYIASQRSKDSGRPLQNEMRHRWYHRLYKARQAPERGVYVPVDGDDKKPKP